jgi:demethylmenaquinone methyltransferase/2-methoxy-6-polyprenyl-1,4-benzoquinol methylase
MLAHAPGKATAKGLDVQFHEADVEALPFPDRAFDICGMAFGIRNVDHPVQALREMARVVKGAGRVVILEFGQPGGLFGAAYRFYSRHVMPPLGKLITGYRQPYEYLPETAAAFPAGLRFLELMDAAGAFSSRLAEPLTGGAVWLYIGVVA